MIKSKQKIIYTFIANLLLPKSTINKYVINNTNIIPNFWDLVVKIGSSNLLLPAINFNLRRKNIKHLNVPKDLLKFLEDISKINSARNYAILEQIHFIGKLFKKSRVDHIFLKGSAMLIDKPYNVVDERMIGDIDILVHHKHLKKANKILKNKGFKPLIYSKIFEHYEHRHLPRLNHPDFISSVELHRSLLKSKYSHYMANDIIFKTKRIINDISIPSREVMWMHSILNWQINDFGFKSNKINLNVLRDATFLEPKNINDLIEKSPKEVQHFYSLASSFNEKYHRSFKFKRFIFNLKIEYKLFAKFAIFIEKLELILQITYKNLYYLFRHPSYIVHLFKKLFLRTHMF